MGISISDMPKDTRLIGNDSLCHLQDGRSFCQDRTFADASDDVIALGFFCLVLYYYYYYLYCD